MTVAALRKKSERSWAVQVAFSSERVHRPFSALQSPQPRRIAFAWHAFPKARQAPSQRDLATMAVRSMVARQGDPCMVVGVPAARGCVPASACRAGMAVALTLPGAPYHALRCTVSTVFAFTFPFYVLGEIRWQEKATVRAIPAYIHARHDEGYTRTRTHSDDTESKLVCLCVANLRCGCGNVGQGALVGV